MSAAAATLGGEGHADHLRALPRSIRAEPESYFAEHRSAARVAEFEAEGFGVETAVGLLRQYLQDGQLRYGILTKGGASLNIVPANTLALYRLRRPTSSPRNSGRSGYGPASGREHGQRDPAPAGDQSDHRDRLGRRGE
ncbi:MAG: hypothetical protein ACRDTH_25765 [Pseudonocardiaceae bacterium]